MRVLFIGNSYILMNRLPRMFAQLARFAGNEVDAELEAEREWTLQAHAGSEKTLSRIREGNWDHVVLQEQSVLPSGLEKEEDMYPFARQLVGEIREAGAAPLFFLTWGRRDGLLVKGMPDFETMQDRLIEGYEEIASELDVALAPVGPAWRNALEERDDISLWNDDGSHPSVAGSYLGACVIFATIFRIGLEGMTYSARLEGETARFLQRIAARTVLDDPGRWNLR